MEIFQGLHGFGGVALGRIRVLNKQKMTEGVENDDPERQLALYNEAKKRVIDALQAEHNHLSHNIEGESAGVRTINSQLMLLQDHQLEDAIYGRIFTMHCDASTAISDAGRYFEDALNRQEDAYIRGKAGDIRELTRRLLSSLPGYDGPDACFEAPVIIAAHSLTSAQLLQIDKTKLLGLIVENSTATSHMTILANAMDIPTIIGCDVSDEWDGMEAVVDGGWRALYLEPDAQTIEDMKVRQLEQTAQDRELQELKGKQCVTLDGRQISLFGNISAVSELPMLLSQDSEGIGLYRTEGAFVNRDTAPEEEELFQEYKEIVSAVFPNYAIIRTVDIAMDREIPYLHNSTESNAALGCRGIRLCFRFPRLFKAQLRALLRASVYGNMAVMFPMISSVREYRQCLEIVEECKQELIAEDVPMKEFDCGVMIETPAAVMISDDLAKYAKFMSIGTNDLTQYTLGVDRENKELQEVCDYHHPAILRMIRMVCDNAHKAHIPAGICGMLASDEELIPYFIDIGIDSLSISPRSILPIRRNIRKLDLSEGSRYVFE